LYIEAHARGQELTIGVGVLARARTQYDGAKEQGLVEREVLETLVRHLMVVNEKVRQSLGHHAHANSDDTAAVPRGSSRCGGANCSLGGFSTGFHRLQDFMTSCYVKIDGNISQKGVFHASK
jgi:hypothetical protein